MKKLLIANRGEIALRIQATAHAFGIKTVAIYTKEDRFLSYVHKANEAHKLTQDNIDGYLDQKEIIQIALQSGADAIHPGYGFLSENHNFAKLVVDSGLVWVGPSPSLIEIMGDKAQAISIMKKNKVPTIPGYVVETKDQFCFDKAKNIVQIIGFPVLLKCAHGGGGKAMRVVESFSDFESAWNLVVSEAKKYFDSNRILIEKKIIKPRHIEVQIAGDGQNYVHFYERECSLQRRNQKIIEESPSLFVKKHIKKILYQAALRAAKATNYDSIGTVEFLVDEKDKFYFLEMNTRLQVEHSVTEMTTNIDLVLLQLYIAINKKLPYKQEEIFQRGHAIECRVYSEDPENNFTPSTGIIKNFVIPNSPFLRADHDLDQETEITPFFDPMILKLSTSGNTRTESTKHMISVLKKTDISGLKTNISFLQKILESKTFSDGSFHTQFLSENIDLFISPKKEKKINLSAKDFETLKKDILEKLTSKQNKVSPKRITWKQVSWSDQKWK